MLLIKSLLMFILLPGTVTCLIPYGILKSGWNVVLIEYGDVKYLGLLFIVPGAIVLLWCVMSFAVIGQGTLASIDPPKTLVIRGFYKFVRNPMYIAVISILIGESLLFSSLLLAAYSILVWIIFHLYIVLFEEPILLKQFSESYTKYCVSVPRWLPRIRS